MENNSSEVLLMKGNEAIAHAAIRCGCDGYFGYPITPQSEILETLAVESFYKGISHPVNPGLQRILGQLGIVEQTGYGNLTIIANYGKEAFDVEENYITVTISFAFIPTMKVINEYGLLPYQTRVLTLIKNHPTYSIKELSKELGLGTTRVGEIIRELKVMNKIERIGGNKGGYWRVK